jgi:hypothetical protein
MFNPLKFFGFGATDTPVIESSQSSNSSDKKVDDSISIAALPVFEKQEASGAAAPELKVSHKLAVLPPSTSSSSSTPTPTGEVSPGIFQRVQKYLPDVKAYSIKAINYVPAEIRYNAWAWFAVKENYGAKDYDAKKEALYQDIQKLLDDCPNQNSDGKEEASPENDFVTFLKGLEHLWDGENYAKLIDSFPIVVPEDLKVYMKKHDQYFKDLFTSVILQTISNLIRQARASSEDFFEDVQKKSPQEILMFLLGKQVGALRGGLFQKLKDLQGIGDDVERQRFIGEQITPIVRGILDKIIPNLGDLGLTDRAVGIIKDEGWPVLLAKATEFIIENYDSVTKPQREYDYHLAKLASRVDGFRGVEEENVEGANAQLKQILQDATYVAAHECTKFIRKKVEEFATDQKSTEENKGNGEAELIKKISEYLPEGVELTPAVKVLLKNFVQMTAGGISSQDENFKNQSDEIDRIWNYIDTIVQTAFMRLASETLTQTLDTAEAKGDKTLAEVIIHLQTMLLKDITPEMAKKRQELDQAREANLAKVDQDASDQKLAIEEQYTKDLRATYQNIIEPLMKLAFPKGMDDLPVPPAFRKVVWGIVEEQVLLYSASLHKQMLDSQKRIEVSDEVVKEVFGIKADLPKMLAIATTARAQQSIINALADESFNATLDENLEKGIKFFKGFDNEAAGRVAAYLEQNKAGTAAQIKQRLKDVNTNIKLQNRLLEELNPRLGKLQVYGMNVLIYKLRENIKKDSLFVPKVVADVLNLFSTRLEKKVQLNKQKTRSNAIRTAKDVTAENAAKEAHQQRVAAFGKRLLQAAGITKETFLEDIPDSLWNIVEEKAIPLAVQELLGLIADPKMINKAVLGALEAYDTRNEPGKGPASNSIDVAGSFNERLKAKPLDLNDSLMQAVEKFLEAFAASSNSQHVKRLLGDGRLSVKRMAVESIAEAITESLQEKGVNTLIANSFEKTLEAIIPGAKFTLEGGRGSLVDAENEANILIQNNEEQPNLYKNIHVARTDAEKAKELAANESEDIDNQMRIKALLRKSAREGVKDGVSSGIAYYWNRFQDAFNSIIEKIFGFFGLKNVGVKVKETLDTICRAVFITAFGSILAWVTKPIRERLLKKAENIADEEGERFTKTLHEMLADQAMVMDIFNRVLNALSPSAEPQESSSLPKKTVAKNATHMASM